ncbi:hypothetical protein ACIQNU_03405 [Streptomyces sp. NPDC091292]|uniref:hypothetical protein n=1 Tax=Streptomyces sp. NPDC091292 TaxID=3365991 RepID=UPI0037F5D52D
MRTRTGAATATTAALLALAACSSGGTPDAKPSASAPSAKTTSSAPEPTPAQDQPRAFGKALTWTADDGVRMSITVMGYEQDVAKNSITADEEFDTNGYVWAAVDIKACLKKGKSGVTRYPWALAYKDGTRIEPSGVTYGDFPKPEYPYEAKLKPGECVRGKTVFPVPGNDRPERVLYTPEALPDGAEWAVPKS